MGSACLPPQRMAAPKELLNGRWAVIADHPSMKGETISGADVKGPPEWAQNENGNGKAQNEIAPEPVGAESGVVERPGKAKARTA